MGETIKNQQFPLVSIIIVNFNGKEILQKTLSKIMEQEYPNFEIIVFDNASTDGSVELIKEQFGLVKVVECEKNLGYARGNNEALKKTNGKYIVLLNNDAFPTNKNWLCELVKTAEKDNRIAIVDSVTYDVLTSTYLGAGWLTFPLFLAVDKKEFHGEEDIFCVGGAGFLVRKKVIDKIGLFDEDYFLNFEEIDLSWRAILAGYEVKCNSKAAINHLRAYSIKKHKMYELTRYLILRNRLITIIKNLSKRYFLISLFFEPFCFFGIMLRSIFKKQKKDMVIATRAYLWILFNLSKIYQKRAHVQKYRVISDKEVIRRLKPLSLQDIIRRMHPSAYI